MVAIRNRITTVSSNAVYRHLNCALSCTLTSGQGNDHTDERHQQGHEHEDAKSACGCPPKQYQSQSAATEGDDAQEHPSSLIICFHGVCLPMATLVLHGKHHAINFCQSVSNTLAISDKCRRRAPPEVPLVRQCRLPAIADDPSSGTKFYYDTSYDSLRPNRDLRGRNMRGVGGPGVDRDRRSDCRRVCPGRV
jgi:hypothetical protein